MGPTTVLKTNNNSRGFTLVRSAKVNHLGFTLVELLVTISIISILSAIGLVVYSSVLKQGRDSKRQSDLRSIQSALEQYYADNFSYPSQAQVVFGSPLSAGGKTYMNTVPKDPNASPYPQYVYTLSSGVYCLYGKLENSSPGIGTTCSPPPNSSYNFAVSPP